jgi:hypothetical protein
MELLEVLLSLYGQIPELHVKLGHTHIPLNY